MIIGLTGGIASGKTAVGKILRDRGFLVLDADTYAHDVLEKDTEEYEEIVSFFGEEILDHEKNIDRRKLGELVFSSDEKRETLNRIVHPAVLNRMLSDVKNENFVIFEVPLLFESGFDKFCDKIVLVTSSIDKQIERLVLRNGLSKEEALLRINSQMSTEEKIKLSTYVIDNEGSLQALEEKVVRIINKLR